MPIYVYQGNKQISTNAIRNDKVVKTIYVKEPEKDIVLVWGVGLDIILFTYIKNDNQSITITGLKSGVKLKYLTIPETIEDLPVVTIKYDAFDNVTVFKSIKLPNTLKTIGSSSFSGCSSLTSITIPDSVINIDTYAFFKCTGLMSAAIGKGVKSIDDSVFRMCTNLISITIPSSVTSISERSFWDCKKLQDIYITDISAWCKISNLIYLMNVTSSNKNLYLNNELATSITIPNDVTEISSSAFEKCDKITSVIIPGSVTNFGNGIFRGCTGLTNITFNGTKAQWNAITKGSSWNSGTGNYTIHCTDGDIPKQ